MKTKLDRQPTSKARSKKPKKQVHGTSNEVSTDDLEAIVFGSAFKDGTGEDGDDALLPPAQEQESSKTAAWSDPDDAALQVPLVGDRHKKRSRQQADSQVTGQEYEQVLRQRFIKLNGAAHWADTTAASEAQLSDSEDEDMAEGIAASTRPIVKTSTSLPPGVLDIVRLRELPLLASGQKKTASAVEALQFHPSSELLLTAGRDKTLRLFAVDGEENTKVASYFFKKFPILNAKFTPSGDQVLMTSTTSQIWGLDVSSGEPFEVRNVSSLGRSAPRCLAMGPASPASPASSSYAFLGDAGAITLCDLKTKHAIRTLRMSAPGAALAFAPHQTSLYTADEECNIYEWDLLSGRCRQKVKEQWSVRIQCLAISTDDKPKLAVGSTTGNVDFLDLEGKLSGVPVHSIGNLTTRIDALRFSADSQILGVASRLKPGALKLIHPGTMTVFQNWPTARTPLQRVSAIDFSSHGGIMAIGNEEGRVLLYKLQHFAKKPE